jgi:pilus assembly protein TadC
MFDDLKKNMEQEKRIVKDMRAILVKMEEDADNKPFYLSSLNSLLEQLVLLNNAVPELLKEGSPVVEGGGSPGAPQVQSEQAKEEGVVKKEAKVVRMSYVSPANKEKRYVTINRKDRGAFLKKLKLSEEALIGMRKFKDKSIGIVVRKPSSFARVSNVFFRRYSESLVPKFSSLDKDLKKANIRFLMSSYLSMGMMSAAAAFVIGFILFGVLLVFNLSNWMYFFLPFVFAGLTLFMFYFYPASEASSLQKKINQELPFATIHMAAIAGSDIEPTKIFKIIARSKEYPSIGREIKKVIAQVDIYGYDLVTSLRNVSVRTSNKKLAELFSGLATNITTGGALKNYLEKKAENFLLDYRLERQKYSDLAGTFMDVYISILIAAPLVLMMMFIVMNVAGLGMGGLSITMLLMLSVVAIVVVNIVFIVVLNFKQPDV